MQCERRSNTQFLLLCVRWPPQNENLQFKSSINLMLCVYGNIVARVLVTKLTSSDLSWRQGKMRMLALTISPSSTTFSPLTMNIPRGMSPNFFPTWIRSTV